MEEPIFVRMFGRSVKAKILNYTLTCRGLDCSMSDIARNSNVSWASLNRNWDELIRLNILTFTRKIGNAKLYKLNEENLVIKKLISIYNQLLIQETEDYFKQKISIKT